MSRPSLFFELLASDAEPTRTAYENAIESVITYPSQVAGLVNDHDEDTFLFYLTTRSQRLATFYQRLQSSQHLDPKRPSTDAIAEGTVTLLLEILHPAHELLGDTVMLGLLAPALSICFTTRPHSLRKLAAMIAGCGKLLEHLASDPSGSRAICQWIEVPSAFVQETETLETWTARILHMARSCVLSHGVTNEIQRWKVLRDLKQALRNLDDRTSKNAEARPQDGVLRLANMTQLKKDDDKKAYLGKRQESHENQFPLLEDDLVRSLDVFELPAPRSSRMVQSLIEKLEGEITLGFLCGAAKTFPCKSCNAALQSTNQVWKDSDDETDEGILPLSDLPLDVFGKTIGIWKIVLSMPALRSIQNIRSSGLFRPVNEKLDDLRSGSWDLQLAGSESQRSRLKVPLAKTKCGQNLFILWQVDVGAAEEAEMQEIKIWEVGNDSEISKAMERAAVIQTSYSPETIRRCRFRPSVLDRKQIPARFNDHQYDSTMYPDRESDLDIRVVDQDTIDMANKFYALTEPVMLSILDNDLEAEYPFDLAKDERQVIRHFQTASLILGRSGTGKTTCLVFKLVGKHLVGKRIVGEKPVRQVFLTRSSILAGKLKAITQRLIETLVSKSLHVERPQDDGNCPSSKAEDSIEESVLTLNDQSFPLVCSYDHFLRILENTVRAFDRQNFQGLEAPYPGQSEVAKAKYQEERQPVDYYGFKVDYWPRFSKALTKTLSVDLVFAEIMGVIKGSASSRDSLVPLCREEYLTRSSRLAPAFNLENDRSHVYEIFETYEALKLERGDVDNVDRVIKVLRAVREDSSLKKLLRSKFDEVYIDEVQDQRMLDIQLLLSFIKDGRGFHFAGDTAQAISQESTFRFSDIKALFYEHFAGVSLSARQGQLARPTMFTLSKNYRSHKAILALASLVMELLWKGFPETVDKLEPEIGQLSGPKPVIFLGCDADILVSTNVGLVKLSERTADFGAEQVILVRDEEMKAELQSEIGDVALVLTILQSKGMEFDDVILWNFFTKSKHSVGIRSLNASMKDERSTFDARKHCAMCSELKNLYVAVTRARIQLFFIESSEDALVSVVEMLTRRVPQPLVEVTRPYDTDFPEKLKSLRPGTSVDPRRWALRGEQLMLQHSYKDALLCFRKAGDERGATFAEGKVYEEEGRRCMATNDTEGFSRNMEAAVKNFTEVNRIGDAVSSLVRMDQFGRAAQLWMEQDEYGKAAPFFAQAKLYNEAAHCYGLASKHTEAAAMLHRGGDYDGLVLYLSKNQGNMLTNSHRTYTRLCNMLLKQGKISLWNRKVAIEMLGTKAEQEDCFIEYEMHEELAELYNDQQKHKDLYRLLIRMGKLERALSIAVKEQLWSLSDEISEDEVLKLLDYTSAGLFYQASQKNHTTAIEIEEKYGGLLTNDMKLKARQWQAGLRLRPGKGIISRQQLAETEGDVVKRFINLLNIIDFAEIAQAATLNEIPYEMIQQAIKILRDLALKDDRLAWSTTLLLLGLWENNNPQEPYVLLPWSPLRQTLSRSHTVDFPRMAKQWVLDQMASAILALDIKARNLWRLKWPVRCVQFLVKGKCPRLQTGEKCHWAHEHIDLPDCECMLKDLLQINAIFCELTVLYYRRVMMGEFQQKFLGIKRHWLERLLRELTYISPFEQDSQRISEIQAMLFRSDKFPAIASALEGLLYHRLGKEWYERNDFSSILEQMQLAKIVGPNIHVRFIRALSNKLFNFPQGGLMQQHLSLLGRLEGDATSQNASQFQLDLDMFLLNTSRVDVQGFSSMHAVTPVFEYLATYLIMMTCPTAFILPKSWIDLHTSKIPHPKESLKPLEWSDKAIYQVCLVRLLTAFCDALSHLDEAFQNPDSEFGFSYGGRNYHSSLLQQRNAELLAIVIVNVRASSGALKGLVEAWAYVQKVFGYKSLRAYHLQHRNIDDVFQKLPLSFDAYRGKNPLVLVSNGQRQLPAIVNLQKYSGVKSISLDYLFSLGSRHTPLDSSANTKSKDSSANPESPKDMPATTAEQYKPDEIRAIKLIQRFWRFWYPKLQRRQTYLQTPEAQAINHYIALGSANHAELSIRALLVSKGIDLYLKLANMRSSLFQHQKDVMSCTEIAELTIKSYESLDNALQQANGVDRSLKNATQNISDAHLTKLIMEGGLEKIQIVLEGVSDAIEDAENELWEIGKIVDDMRG